MAPDVELRQAVIKEIQVSPLYLFFKKGTNILITHKNHNKYYNRWRYNIDIIPSHSKSIAVVQ